jgi:hypothetical protein
VEEKKRIDLKYPIEIDKNGDKKVYSFVEIGRMKNKHLKMLPKDFFAQGKKAMIPPSKLPDLIAAICEIPLKVAEEMDFEDTMTISECLQDFFGTAQTKDGQE